MNQWINELILPFSHSTRTIPVGIGLFVGEYLDVWNQMAAAAILFSIPPLIPFTLTRKTFIKGLVAGAGK
jgi:multiple sugar transport system permease protein